MFTHTSFNTLYKQNAWEDIVISLNNNYHHHIKADGIACLNSRVHYAVPFKHNTLIRLLIILKIKVFTLDTINS